MSEYIGKDRVHEALRRLLEKHGSGAPPLPTTLDLYRELRAVTPDSLQSLLRDLFEANTFWELETEQVTAEQTEAGAWQVTLDLRARKVVVDLAGVETEVPLVSVYTVTWLEHLALSTTTGTVVLFGVSGIIFAVIRGIDMRQRGERVEVELDEVVDPQTTSCQALLPTTMSFSTRR